MEQADELFRTVSSLPPSELAAFDAVVRHGGFRPAARATGASASALSHAVAGLERRLKTHLLLRSSRHVALTEAGQRFLTALRPALAQIGEAVSQIHDQDNQPGGTIRITASTIAAEQIMETVFEPFLKAFPLVRIEICEDGALVDLAGGGFDCGLRLLEQVPAEMVAIPVGLRHQQHIVVGAQAYLDAAPPILTPADLAAHECIQLRLSPNSLYRWEFSRDGKDLTVRTSGRLLVASPRLALKAAIGGLGLAYVTRWSAADALKAGDVIPVLESWTPPYPGLAMYYPRHRHMGPAMKALVAFVRRPAVGHEMSDAGMSLS